jgi:hypothetical protein
LSRFRNATSENREIVNLTINGVDIAPLVDAELNRRYPDRAKMRPTDPAGFREAWDVIERQWGETVGRGPVGRRRATAGFEVRVVRR